MGKGGSRKEPVRGHFICRKHLGKHEGWLSCGPAPERGNSAPSPSPVSAIFLSLAPTKPAGPRFLPPQPPPALTPSL